MTVGEQGGAGAARWCAFIIDHPQEEARRLINTLNITPALSMKFIYIRVRPTRSTSEGLSDRGSVDASEEEVGL